MTTALSDASDARSQGFILWLTGLSGSGKSTLATLLAAELRAAGVHVEVLDGDDVRKNLSKGLGFSRDDRDTNVRRLGFVAKLVARSGACAITAAISPYREVRDEVRRSFPRFCEVFCDCPIEVLAERDPKGLYRRALRGEIRNFTGVDDPYESPPTPEVHLRTDLEPPHVSVERVLDSLRALGYLGRKQREPNSGTLVAAHGGELPDLQLRGRAREEFLERASKLPALELSADLELLLVAIAMGELAPLRGFMNRKDCLRVQREQRLENGLRWPIPITLPVPESMRSAQSVALTRAGRMLGKLEVSDAFQHHESKQWQLAGDVSFVEDFFERNFGPREVRGLADLRGWRDLAILPSGTGVRHLRTLESALDFCEAVVTLVPRTEPSSRFERPGELSAQNPVVTSRAWLPAASPPADMLLLSLILARNFGASRCILPRVSGGQRLDQLFRKLGAEELGVEPWWYASRD